MVEGGQRDAEAQELGSICRYAVGFFWVIPDLAGSQWI